MQSGAWQQIRHSRKTLQLPGAAHPFQKDEWLFSVQKNKENPVNAVSFRGSSKLVKRGYGITHLLVGDKDELLTKGLKGREVFNFEL